MPSLSLPPTPPHPHPPQVYSLSWNLVRRDCFLSGSWDDTVRLWSLASPTSLRTFAEHTYCVYAAQWNPQQADVFLSASGDCTVKVGGWGWVDAWSRPLLSLCSSWETCGSRTTGAPTRPALLPTPQRLPPGRRPLGAQVWDVRQPGSTLSLAAHQFEVLSADWCKYNDCVIATGSVDKSIKVGWWGHGGGL